MIETIILQHMAEATTPWYLMRPKNVPNKYGLIEKTGSSRENHLYRSTFAFQSYAPTLEAAAEISAEARELMDTLPEEPGVSGVRFDTEYNFTDPETRQPRYQAVFVVYHY
jgi:hypothetical protein